MGQGQISTGCSSGGLQALRWLYIKNRNDSDMEFTALAQEYAIHECKSKLYHAKKTQPEWP